jgi:hypothetical protein
MPITVVIHITGRVVDDLVSITAVVALRRTLLGWVLGLFSPTAIIVTVTIGPHRNCGTRQHNGQGRHGAS